MIAQLQADLDELASDLVEITADLSSRLQDAVEGKPAVPAQRGRPAAWCWRDLGPEAAAELWEQLTDWVTWLRGRYPIGRRLPACWAEHPATVEDLTALWLAWQQAYQDPDAPLTAPAEWHDRWLPGFLHRIQHGPMALDCNNEHQEHPGTV